MGHVVRKQFCEINERISNFPGIRAFEFANVATISLGDITADDSVRIGSVS